MDEFPSLVQADPTLSSVLQVLWDEELKATKLFLVLCGSWVSFMEGELLSQKSPLFGWRTGQYMLLPFSAREAGLFFPNKSQPTWSNSPPRRISPRTSSGKSSRRGVVFTTRYGSC